MLKQRNNMTSKFCKDNQNDNFDFILFFSRQNQNLVLDQQKYIETLQQEIARLQKRLIKIENDGVVEPSILFTRLDAERNERTLRKAFDNGKLPEKIFDVR